MRAVVLQDISGVVYGQCGKLARQFAVYGKHGRTVEGFPMRNAADARLAIQTKTTSSIRARAGEPLAVAHRLGHRAMCLAVIDKQLEV